MRRLRSAALPTICAMLVAVVLSGCRENEQGRVLLYEKGTYLGKPDTALDDEQLNELSGRIANQSFN